MSKLLESLLIDVLNMSLTASVIILVVLLARFLLRRAPRIFSYTLWAVVLFRLLCPFSFSAAFSLLGMLQNEPAVGGQMTYIPENIGYQMEPTVQLPVPALSNAINGSLPAGNPQGSVNPVQIFLWLGSWLWLLGILALVLYGLLSFLQLQKCLRTTIRERDHIYRSDAISTPFVCGIFRPRIYLPTGLDREEERYILLHEQTHIRRKDHLFRLLASLALCLHWFNPLVWLAFFLSEKDMEMSCDEAVIRQVGSGVKKQYSESLLSIASGRHHMRGIPLAFGEKDTKSRIKNILRYQKSSRIFIGLTAALCLILAAVLLANPAGSDESSADFSADDLLSSQTVYYGVIGYAQINGPEYLIVEIPGIGGMTIPDAEIIYPYIETDFDGLEAGDLVRIVFPEGISPEIMESYPGQFSESAESIAVMGQGSFALDPYSYDPCRLAIPLGLALEAEQGDTVEIYNTEETFLASAVVLAVDETAQNFWIELSAENTTAFLSRFADGIRCRIIPHVPMEEELVQESGNDLISDSVDILSTEDLSDGIFKDGTYLLYIQSISRSAAGIDRYVISSPREDGPQIELPFLPFVDYCAFLVNQEMDTVRYEAVSFDEFASVVTSGLEVSRIPCTVTLENNQITRAALDSSWYDYGISYQPFVRDSWYADIQSFPEMEGIDPLETYYSLVRTEYADIAEARGTETIEIYTGNIGDGDSGLVLFKNENGDILYSEGAHASRAGWNNLYVGESDGTAFLMRVHIEDRDTYGGYDYQVFRLGAYGQILQIAGSSFEFDDDRIPYDDDLFREWIDGMDSYLEHCHLLLSTQEMEVRTDPVSDADRYNYENLRR